MKYRCLLLMKSFCQVVWFVQVVLFVGGLCCSVAATSLSAASPTEAWHQLIVDSWEFDMQESPLLATRVGDHRFNDQLPRVGVKEDLRRFAAKRAFRDRAKAIDRAKLTAADKLNFDIWLRLLDDQIAEYEFKSYLIPISNREGFHIRFPELPKQVPLQTRNDYEDYLARLRAFDQYAAQHVELLQAGIDEGYTLPAVVLEGYEDSITAHIVDDPEASLLYEPFTRFPDTVPDDARDSLARAGRQAIEESVVPGYRRFAEFMNKEYIPSCRSSIGAAALPRGREFYRHRVRKFTTLNKTPEEIHKLGFSEVKRIRQEMQEVLREVEFEGDFAEFLQYLRTADRFYAKTPEALLKEVAFVLKKMDGELPKLFKTLPRTPYGIRKVPDYIAPKTTTAYYMQPSGDGTQAGFYYVNTFNLKSRPLYSIEALSLHEAVPGHHLQIALQQELTEMPEFRRFAGFTAFVEGWALYAERLGLETGFYQDPYRDFGRLTYEMWRACRLVVDTGVHYLGWSRDQAIEFMARNSGLAMHNIRAEVDRYISWPGQALAYKIGELKIRELRKLAEDELGDAFDVREFHDVVLLAGAVPLDILEQRVRDYIARTGK